MWLTSCLHLLFHLVHTVVVHFCQYSLILLCIVTSCAHPIVLSRAAMRLSCANRCASVRPCTRNNRDQSKLPQPLPASQAEAADSLNKGAGGGAGGGGGGGGFGGGLGRATLLCSEVRDSVLPCVIAHPSCHGVVLGPFPPGTGTRTVHDCFRSQLIISTTTASYIARFAFTE